jgi:protein-tyrosine-phosphatase
MAAAFFNQFADASKANAISAGTQPANAVHPVVLQSMKSAGIDLSNIKPQMLTPEALLRKDTRILLTVYLAECFFNTGIIERWGTGTLRMAAALDEQG